MFATGNRFAMSITIVQIVLSIALFFLAVAMTSSGLVEIDNFVVWIAAILPMLFYTRSGKYITKSLSKSNVDEAVLVRFGIHVWLISLFVFVASRFIPEMNLDSIIDRFFNYNAVAYKFIISFTMSMIASVFVSTYLRIPMYFAFAIAAINFAFFYLLVLFAVGI